MYTKRPGGFTLIELIMVISIIGILASMAMAKFFSLRQEAREASCFQAAAAIQTALSTYYVRQSLTAEPTFPVSLHNTVFTGFLVENTLPEHPLERDWNDYYLTTPGDLEYSFTIGSDTVNGACGNF